MISALLWQYHWHSDEEFCVQCTALHRSSLLYVLFSENYSVCHSSTTSHSSETDITTATHCFSQGFGYHALDVAYPTLLTQLGIISSLQSQHCWFLVECLVMSVLLQCSSVFITRAVWTRWLWDMATNTTDVHSAAQNLNTTDQQIHEIFDSTNVISVLAVWFKNVMYHGRLKAYSSTFACPLSFIFLYFRTASCHL